MLERIAELEGAAEHLPPGREASVVRTKLQEARLAELERLRGRLEPPDLSGAMAAMAQALDRGRRAGADDLTGTIERNGGFLRQNGG